MDTRPRWLRDHPMAAATLLVAAGTAGGLLAARSAPEDLQKALYAASVALVFTALLGGIVKLLMDDVAAARRRQENAAEFVVNVLRDLKSVYDRVARVRIVVPAHRSVKTYGDEMRDVIESGVVLRNVDRAVKQRLDLPEALRQGIHRETCRMETYLDRLTAEFRDQYKPLSDAQAAYEAARKAGMANAPDPWPQLQALPHLAGLMQGDEVYRAEFEAALDAATGMLRRELARMMGFPEAAAAPATLNPALIGSVPGIVPPSAGRG
jgi:hypothetical protein